jgi:RHS repeat-associated protein
VPAGLPWTQTSAGGAVTQYHYFADGDVSSVTDPAGLLTCDSYDGVGRLTTKTVIYTSGATCASPGLVTSYTYDRLGHPVTTTAPATTDMVTGAAHTPTTTNVYDADGDLTSTTVSDPTGGDATRTSTLTYNSLDQVQSSTDSAQATTTYTYNALGLKATVQNAAGDTTAYTYDGDGRLTYTTLKNYTGSPSGSQSAADLVQEARTYDPAGRLASVTDAMGYATLYQYTDNGLTAKVTRCSAMTVTGGVPTCTGSSYVEQSTTYDGAGNQVKQVTNNGTTETDYVYDAAGRETSTTLDPNGLKRTTSKSYTADDFVASQTTSGANGSATTDYSYTPAGVMTSQSVENYATGAPTGWWKLNDGAAGATTPSAARDWSGQNNTGTLSSGVSWAPGAASFNGTSGVINTAGPVLNTAASYSISAWVNLASTAQDYQTLVGQSSADGGNVYLEYSPTFGGWSFILRKADNSATGLGAYDYASSSTGVAANTWTHLTAVYNASTGAMQLYVNGALAATATDTTPWLANGLTNIGATANASERSNYTDGQIANVQLYPRALSATDVSTLYTNGRTGAALSASSNTTSWQVDPRGLATLMTDPDGNTTSYVYDAAGSRVQTIAPTVTTGSYNTASGTYTAAAVAPVTSTGYDTFGDVAETKDPDGNTTVYTYDADGRQTAATLPSYTQPGTSNHATIAAAKTVTHYNSLGEVDKSWDAAATETDFTYDQLGHQTSATLDPTGLDRTATSVYDADGDVLKTTDPSGAIQASTYDYLGRQLTATQVLGIGGAGSTQIPTGCQTYNNVATQAACTSTSQYTGTAGFLSQDASAAGVITQYGYDTAGERTSVTDGANQTTTTAYDYAGRVVKTTAPDGTYTAATYNPAGQQTATSQYDNTGTLLRSATASYDGSGNLLSTTDADANVLIAQGKAGYSTTFTYDATGLLQSETQPVSATSAITTAFGYDAAGHQTRYITGNNNAWNTTYNPWGLPESQIEPTTATYTTAAASTTTVVYDADGRPIEQDAPGGVVSTSSYDTAGETLTQSGTGAEAATATRSFTYYNNGLIKTAATSNTATSGSNATSESFAYDDSGALTSASGSAGTSAFTYTPDGQMASRADTVGGSTYTTGYGYDSAGRLSTIADPLTGTTDTYGYTPDSLNYTITYGAGGDVRAFAYNTAHELASDTLTSGPTTVASIAYGYDANGNETAKTTTGFTGAAANTYAYDQAGRLKSWNNGTTVTGYSYDQDGNRTQAGANVFTYDARDQLTSDGVTSYAYTARGTLQSSTSTANGSVATTADAYGQIQTDAADAYTYDALGRLAAVGANTLSYSGTGNTLSNDGYTTYARDPSGALISDLQPGLTGRVDWTDQHTDVVGYFAPGASNLTGSVAYDPLGQVLSKTGHQTSLGYQSEYTRATTGKVNMAARWYNPATGQFTSKDAQSNSPVPDSANANPFAYANGNPLTATDPSGHCAHPDGDFCADKGANAASQASAGNTTVLTASAKPAVWAAYIHHLQDVIHQYVVTLPHPVRTITIIKDTPGTGITCNSGLALSTGCTPGQPLQATTVAPGLDTQGVQAGSAGAGIAAFAGTYAACDAAGLGPEDVLADFLCLFPAGAASGAASQGVNCAGYGGSQCSLQAFDGAIGTGMATLFAGALTGSVACRLLCAGLAGDLAPSLEGGLSPSAPAVTPGDEGFVGPVASSVSDDEPILNSLRQAAQKAERDTSPTGTPKTSTTPDNNTPTNTPSGGGAGDVSVDTQPATPVVRDESPAVVKPTAPAPAADEITAPSCSVLPHSFTGSTPVLMADGSTKAIDQIKVGDQIADSVPGQTGTQTNTVTNVIVTKTDHDFVNLTVAPLTSSTAADMFSAAATPARGSTTKSNLKKAAVSLAAALTAIVGTPTTQHTADPTSTPLGQSVAAASLVTTQRGGTLTTTFHHPFYDITQAAFVDAQNLKPGDELQTPTGRALVTSVRLYHANTVTYDLTIGSLHTYYVVAGNTPVLVHNSTCIGFANDLAAAQAANPLVESLGQTGGLPPEYMTKVQAEAAGWQPGKALGNKIPGGQLGGDIFENSTGILPGADGRVWHEADLGINPMMTRAKQPGWRLLYSNDGLTYVTSDHYESVYQLPNWK